MRLTLAAAALTAGLLGAMAANAGPIAAGSELSLNGSDQFDSTSITFVNPANIGGTSGSFAAALGAVPPQITGDATLFDFTNASSDFELYTATANGATTTLVNAMITSFDFTPGSPLESLDVKGTGTLTLSGFADTPGFWDLTTQGPGGTAVVTFSYTAIAGVAEPASFALLGSALLMLGLWGRNRQLRGV